MKQSGHTWALILAAGDGSRLRALTSDRSGMPVPKQYCSLRGGATLLEDTIRRAEAFCTPAHISLIVADRHREWWEPSLSRIPSGNIVVQPGNRGTAVGVLLQLLQVLRLDPQAEVLLLPSDHFIGDEPVMERAQLAALDHIRKQPLDIVLLGMEPSFPDPELGYILPGTNAVGALPSVREFTEKPSVARARALIAAGALWNAFILAARGSTLLELFERRLPDVVLALRSSSDLADTYEQLPVVDFSRHVLSGTALRRLRVLAVPECGWNDLGTPERVGETLARLPPALTAERETARDDCSISLASGYERAATAGWPAARAAINE
jgi:mannose-1-phosphate guanylyltransferase